MPILKKQRISYYIYIKSDQAYYEDQLDLNHILIVKFEEELHVWGYTQNALITSYYDTMKTNQILFLGQVENCQVIALSLITNKSSNNVRIHIIYNWLELSNLSDERKPKKKRVRNQNKGLTITDSNRKQFKLRIRNGRHSVAGTGNYFHSL